MPANSGPEEGRSPSPRRGRPPLVENHRQLILDRAAALFGAHGYQGVGIAALADDLGISKAAVFHYFRSKREIYDSIVLDALRELHTSVTNAIADESDPRSELLAFMRAHAQFFEDNYWKFVVMLVGFGGISSTFAEEAIEIRDAYEARLRLIIEKGIAQNVFRDVDPATVGRAVLSMLNWMARWYRADGPRAATDIAGDYGSLLLSGLSKPTSNGT